MVGLVRGALIAGGVAICEVILRGVGELPVEGAWAIVIPFVPGLVRFAEGWLDGLKSPSEDPRAP